LPQHLFLHVPVPLVSPARKVLPAPQALPAHKALLVKQPWLPTFPAPNAITIPTLSQVRCHLGKHPFTGAAQRMPMQVAENNVQHVTQVMVSAIASQAIP
jgi:hypothetical protein